MLIWIAQVDIMHNDDNQMKMIEPNILFIITPQVTLSCMLVQSMLYIVAAYIVQPGQVVVSTNNFKPLNKQRKNTKR